LAKPLFIIFSLTLFIKIFRQERLSGIIKKKSKEILDKEVGDRVPITHNSNLIIKSIHIGFQIMLNKLSNVMKVQILVSMKSWVEALLQEFNKLEDKNQNNKNTNSAQIPQQQSLKL